MEEPEIPIVAQEPWQRTLYILFFSQLMVAVGFSSIFPFLPLYVADLGSSSGLSVELLSGLVFSVQAFTMMLASPIWGTLADRHGRKIMVERSMFGGAVILLMMAFVTSAEQLVLLRAIQGLVTGTVPAASALLASVTPRRQTGYAMGFLQVGFGTGLAVGPLIGGAVADIYGYNSVLYLTSTMLLLAGITVLFGVREKFDPAEVAARQKTSILSNWRALISIPGVLVTFVVRFLTSLGRMMIVPILPLFIQTLLSDPSRLNTFTGLALGIASGSTTVSSVFLGKLGDKSGYRRVLIGALALLAGLYSLLGFVTTGWQLLVVQVLIGVSLGGVVPIISALLANYIKSGGEGSVFGLDSSVNAAGRSAAPLLGGMIAASWGYSATFLATGLVYILTVLLAIRLLPPSRSGASSENLNSS
jgi:DHA1 family multidrug resistance protein-like MFS transporter